PLINYIDTNSENQDKEIAQILIYRISKADHFSWIYHKCEPIKNAISFVYYCNSREELKNKRPRIDNVLKQRDSTARIHRHNCGAMDVTPQVREYIAKNHLLTVPQLYENIKEEKIDGFLHLTRHQ
ncbi:8689_t:CDS:2, partial [Cetraspora pellucida]